MASKNYDEEDDLRDSDVSYRPSFDYSNRLTYTQALRPSFQGRDSLGSINNDVFMRGSLLDREIQAEPLSLAKGPEKARDYKGRITRWPGICLFAFVFAASVALMTIAAIQHHRDANQRALKFNLADFDAGRIRGGLNRSIGNDLIADDGIVGNPKVYPPSSCELPNYVSKQGQIFAISANGTEVPIQIKGINWFGMETGQHIPFGLWDNSENGTTAYQIATFLAENKFNAVRLPVMVDAILKNTIPNQAIINRQENRAIDVSDYRSLLQSIIKVLQFRRIGVLISMHTLTFQDNGALWYNSQVTEKDFLESITILSSSLCSEEYWNIIGLDLKNEPYKATWGDGTAKDFRAGAIRMADTMLKSCSKWLGFVEGINGQHSVDIKGTVYDYFDWYGGGLQGAKKDPIDFGTPNKVVYAPHYYTPAVFPQRYLYGGGTKGTGSTIQNYVELSDDELRYRIKVTMDDMFGFLAGSTGPALLLGEFGGLYTKDLHPLKTTERCTNFSIEIITSKGWSGGFVWSLNPESAYQYNPADTAGSFYEGILQDDWLSVNEKFLDAMRSMDQMPELKPFPCFLKVKKDKKDKKT